MLSKCKSPLNTLIEKILYEKKVFHEVKKVTDYCSENQTEYEIIKAGITTTICYPDYFEGSEKRLAQFGCPDIYYAKMNDIYVYPETSILTDKNIIYCDTIVDDREKRCDFRGGPIIDIIDDSYHCAYFKSFKKIEKGIWLNGVGARNIFHLTLEILSKIRFVDLYEEYKDFPLIMDEAVFRIPQLKELVDLVNISKHPIIPIAARTKVGELVYISPVSAFTFNTKERQQIAEDYRITQEAIFNVRSCILGMPDINKIAAKRKIFCSRKKTNNVRLINSEVVEELFERYGFEIVYPEDMSMIEQIKLFRGAKYIAGASGAAFTNIIYCHEDAKLIYIFPEKERSIDYPTIANLIGMKCIGLDATIIGNADTLSTVQYLCDLEYCERFLKEEFSENAC